LEFGDSGYAFSVGRFGMARDYKKEYRTFHGKPAQRKKRSTRNKARRVLKLKTGNPKEVDHRRPLSKGGTNARGNLRAVSRKTNRKKGAK
jgi:5-methylcytosine-specific restriction endonuclease McrA